MLDDFCVPLLCHLSNDVTIWADYQNSRPVVQLERIPDVKFAIIDTRMLYIIPNHGLSEHMQSLLFVKLSTVNSYEGDLGKVFELVLELLKLCQYMDAINAATRPEVNYQKFVLEVLVHGK